MPPPTSNQKPLLRWFSTCFTFSHVHNAGWVSECVFAVRAKAYNYFYDFPPVNFLDSLFSDWFRLLLLVRRLRIYVRAIEETHLCELFFLEIWGPQGSREEFEFHWNDDVWLVSGTSIWANCLGELLSSGMLLNFLARFFFLNIIKAKNLGHSGEKTKCKRQPFDSSAADVAYHRATSPPCSVLI